MVGRQAGREIRPYTSQSGSSKELLFLYNGYRSAEDVFQSEHAQNRMTTWAFRIGAWLVIFIGLNCVSHVIEMIGRRKTALTRSFAVIVIPTFCNPLRLKL